MIEKTIEEKKNFIKLGHSINWLPAVVVKGEGVFFEFNEQRLNNWLQNSKFLDERIIFHIIITRKE